MDIFDLVDPEFNGTMSSDELWYGGESNICLTDVVEHKADYDHTHTNYAATDHTHEGYAEATHTHTEYATVNHTHTEYANASHNHNTVYAAVNHTHTNKADLVNGKVPISQIPNEVKEVRFANTIAERNAMTGLFVGLTVIVVDATADPTVSSGSAWYVYTGYGWAKTAESESMDVVLEWANIQGKPTVFPPETHTHNEYAALSDIESLQNSMNNKADVNHTHTGFASQSDLDLLEDVVATKADSTHTHSDYVSQADFELLEDVVGAKADASHSHSDYVLSTHSHNDYATQTSLDALESEINGKADIGHTHDYASSSHIHNEYAEVGHSHTVSEIGAASSDHNHDSDYSPLNHSHTDYATATSLNELSATVSGKANTSHSHDDVYYTETEIDSKLATKAETAHTHTGVYDESGAAASALTSANAYTDSKIDALVGEGASTTLDTIGEISSAIEDNQDAIDLLNSAIANKANASDLTSHTGNTTIHITSAERNSWNAKSDFSGNYNDLTNKPSIPSIDGLATETYVDTQISAIDIPSALSDLTTDSTHRVVTDAEKAAWNAKSNFSGSYNDLTNKPTIPSISGLATEAYVDEAVSTKANSNHNHNSSYDALGTAETKANAVQANLNVVSENLSEHIDNADIHFTTAERTKLSGIAANANNYTHPNSGVTAGTYKSVTVNAQGHITGGTNPTTLAGYGITDAETKGAANSALNSAKAYTDELIADEVANRDAAIATAKSSAISTAASDATTKANNALASAKTYADNAAATVKNDLLNNAGAAYDTLKELGDLIDDNADAIEALETVASGKANAVHTHAISDITNLQSTLNGKAATNHGTHVTYSTTAPVMDGAASVGSATTVARSDHKHPTDTSRASQTSLDSHTSNKSNPHGVTLAQLGITATATELNTLDGITATVTELNYVDGVTSNIQTQLNAKAPSSHTHNYAGSSSAGGAATSANKLNTNAGDANTPVYFANGVPVACTSLALNTTGSSASCTGNAATATNVAWSGVTSKPSYYDAKAIKSITRNGTTFTYTCMDGTTGTFTQQDNNTTYAVATTSANGLMSASDKSKLDGMVLATVSEVETYLGI